MVSFGIRRLRKLNLYGLFQFWVNRSKCRNYSPAPQNKRHSTFLLLLDFYWLHCIFKMVSLIHWLPYYIPKCRNRLFSTICYSGHNVFWGLKDWMKQWFTVKCLRRNRNGALDFTLKHRSKQKPQKKMMIC